MSFSSVSGELRRASGYKEKMEEARTAASQYGTAVSKLTSEVQNRGIAIRRLLAGAKDLEGSILEATRRITGVDSTVMEELLSTAPTTVNVEAATVVLDRAEIMIAFLLEEVLFFKKGFQDLPDVESYEAFGEIEEEDTATRMNKKLSDMRVIGPALAGVSDSSLGRIPPPTKRAEEDGYQLSTEVKTSASTSSQSSIGNLL
jgi:hypothetical protein